MPVYGRRGSSIARILMPNTLNTQSLRAMALNVTRSISRRTVVEFKKVTRTWNHQPVFLTRDMYHGGNLISQVETYDTAFVVNDKGTENRHAIMSRDFISKTIPWKLSSRRGRGRKVRVSKNVHLHTEARHWTIAVRDKLEPQFLKDANAGLAKVIRDSERGTGRSRKV